MSGINRVILTGHLGRNPELRCLTDGVAVVSFPLATSEMTGKGGSKHEFTEWHQMILWRGLAERAARLLKKGDLVYFEGKIRTRAHNDAAGIKRYATEIVAEHFSLLSKN